MTQDEIKQWASAYVEAQQDPEYLKEGHPLCWAIERFMIGLLSCAADAEDCWKAILEVLALNPPENVLGVLAAGPLEDLIDECGEQFIERIEREAREHRVFRDLLRGVWKSGSPEIWQRVQRAQEAPTGFMD